MNARDHTKEVGMPEALSTRAQRRVTREQAIEAVRTRVGVSIAVAAVAIEKSEALTRRAVEAGEIRAVRLGRNWSVLTGPLREQFGIDA